MIKLTPHKPPYYENVTPTKIYIALLTQSGTNAPTAIEVKNTIGGTPTYTRENNGTYKITWTGKFPETKTIPLIGTGNTAVTTDNPILADIHRESDDEIWINTLDQTFNYVDGNLYLTPIQITIY